MPPKRAPESQFVVPEPEGEPDPVNGISAFELPKSLVTRIAKGALPSGGKTSKEVPAALQKSATVFISYLTAHAQEIAAANNQKTLSAQHVLEAVRQLPWSDASDIEKEMQEELRIWRDKKAKGKAAAPRKPAASKATGEDVTMVDANAPEEAQATSEEEDAPEEPEPDEEPDEDETMEADQ